MQARAVVPRARLRRVPLALLYYLPVAVLFVAAALTENRAIGLATCVVAVGGAAIVWLTSLGFASRLARGPMSARARAGRIAAVTLAIFALGLPSFVMIKVFSPAYFAREDTATPMRYAVVGLTANTLGSIALFFLFRRLGLMPHPGIAVATTLGGRLNACLPYAPLLTRGEFTADARLARARPRRHVGQGRAAC